MADKTTRNFSLNPKAPPNIGETTPATAAFTQATVPTIYGSSAANGDITIEGTSDSTKTSSYVILQPNGGNVSIGTTSPYVGLHCAKRYIFLSNSDFVPATTGTGIVYGLGAASGNTYGYLQTSINGDTGFGEFLLNKDGGNVKTGNNFSLGTETTFGTSAAKVLAIGEGTAPTTSPADAVQLWSANVAGEAGKNGLHIRGESGSVLAIGASNPTSGAGTGITVNSTGHLNRQTYKVTTTYAAYSDTDTTKGVVIATLPAKMKIVGFYADTTAAYTGGAVTAATLKVGITAEDAAEIIASHDVFSGVVTKGLADADMGTSMTRAAQIQGGYLPSWSGTTAIYATINTTTANTNALTAGSTTFYLVTEQF